MKMERELLQILNGFAIALALIFWNFKMHFHYLFLKKIGKTSHKNYLQATLGLFTDLSFWNLNSLPSPLFYSSDNSIESKRAILFSLFTILFTLISFLIQGILID